jgi:hypothetical protein
MTIWYHGTRIYQALGSSMGSPSDLDAQRKALRVLIDKLARRVQANCNPEAEGQLQEAAAVRLQAAARGLLGRR